MRNVARAKAGYYPTPPEVVTLLARILENPRPEIYYHGQYGTRHTVSKPVYALDPSCGTGAALAQLTAEMDRNPEDRADWHLHGIELDRNRARAARKVLEQVLHGDAFDTEATGYQLLFLNPPYDDAPGGRRLEDLFLEHFIPALVPGGVLVLIVQEKSLPLLAPRLHSHFHDLVALRFPPAEYRAFEQVVVLGRRRQEVAPPQEDLTVTDELGAYAAAIPRSYAVLPAKGNPPFLYRRLADPEELRAFARESGAWAALAARMRTSQQGRMPAPLVPLSHEHLALLLAGGQLNDAIVTTPEGPLLIRGRVRKVTTTIEETNDKGTRVIERERYAPVLDVLNLKTFELEVIE